MDMKTYYLILTAFIGILSFLLYSVKDKQSRERHRRRKLIQEAERLTGLQVHMLCSYGLNEDESFLLWLTKDMHHYLMAYIAQAKLDWEGKFWLNWYVISKYPQLFTIFNRPDKCSKRLYLDESREGSLNREVQRWEQKNGTFQKEYGIWRMMAEKERRPWFYTDCTVETARDAFSAACHMEERIPFIVMLRYEQRFDSEIENRQQEKEVG